MPQNKYQKFEPKGGSTNQLTFQVVGSELVRCRLDLILLEVCNTALVCRLDLSWTTLYSLCLSSIIKTELSSYTYKDQNELTHMKDLEK